MNNLRRVYLYLVSAITLQAVAWSIIALLRNLTGSGLQRAATSTIAAQIAMILVGLPLYLVHWRWAQQAALQKEMERTSAARRVYLDGMLLAFIFPFLSSAINLLQTLLYTLLGAAPRVIQSQPSAWYFVISLMTTGIFALYHYRVRQADEQSGVDDDGLLLIDHLAIYIVTLTGLILTAAGVAQLIRLLGGLLSDPFAALESEVDLANNLSLIVIGLPLWLVSWRQAQRRFYSADPREQLSFVRKAALYLIIFISSLFAVVTLAILLANFLMALLNVPSASGGLMDALSVIIVSVVVWAYHARVLQQDAAVAETAGLAESVRRIYLYLVSGVGLTALLIGIGGILSVIIRAIDGAGLGIDLREQLAWFTATLIAGLPVWLISWRRIQVLTGQGGAAGIEERSSFTRRFYLTLFAFVAVLTLLGGAVYVVAQIVELILGSRATGGLLTDVGQALAYTMIAVAVLIYHGLLLRSDQRFLDQQELEGQRRLHVAVVDSGNGRLGRLLIDHIRKQLPGIHLGPVPLTEQARTAMVEEEEEEGTRTPAEILREANVVVTPWQMTADSSAELIIDDETSDAYYQSTAHKLLLPLPRRGVTWIGVEPWQEKAITQEVEDVLKRMAKGERPSAIRRLSTPAILFIVLASLLGLLILVPLVIQLLSILLDF